MFFLKKKLWMGKDISGRVFISNDPKKVANNSDCIITDMDINEKIRKIDKKISTLPSRSSLMSQPNLMLFYALFTSIQKFEVTNDVINSNKSVVFDQAENRIHAQKSIKILF